MSTMRKNVQEATVLVCGNPNSGKTTVFNGLTGSRQRVGNWPGVTVEMTAGIMVEPPSLAMVTGQEREPESAPPAGSELHEADATVGRTQTPIHVVDLPGIYSLSAASEDEMIARDALVHTKHDLVVNVVDSANLERNLYLTLQLIEMGSPLLLVLTMTDLAHSRGIQVDAEAISRQLGCPVVAVDATTRHGITEVKRAVAAALTSPSPSPQQVSYPQQIADQVDEWANQLQDAGLPVNARYAALRLLEGDHYLENILVRDRIIPAGDIRSVRDKLQQELDQDLDIAIAEARYHRIQGISEEVVQRKPSRESITEKIDRVALSRVWGLPTFFAAMYLVFWATVSVGGAFIDFFDIAVGTITVDGFGTLLNSIGTPQWAVTILADGAGTGVQTVATFVPVIFMMFFMLSLLEDSGYMARAAFVMDRVMRWVGLPGKAFVPLLVGFGCTVPAITATRTLEGSKDRYMTIFMSPFMSCGARLPVYALFAAALFPARAGLVVFSLYVVGMLLAIVTGIVLKHTLFRGSYSHFVMELPPYHIPRLWAVTRLAVRPLRICIVRAGITITTVVTILAVMNSVGTDGSFGNQDTQESVLSAVGRTVTPVFSPMGIDQDNWPATVGLFTGLFAKEAVVGTLSSLYTQSDEFAESSTDADVSAADAGDDQGFNLLNGFTEAWQSLVDGLRDLGGTLTDPVGAGIIADPGELEVDDSLFGRMRGQFSPAAGYAYLLFVLIYFPCVAALGAAIQEMGKGYGWLLAGYLTALAWAIAVLFYQFASAPQPGSVLAAVGVLVLLPLLLQVIAVVSRRRGTGVGV